MILLRFMPAIPRVDHISHSPWIGAALIAMTVGVIASYAANRQRYKLLIRSMVQHRSRVMNYDKQVAEPWADALISITVLFSTALVIFVPANQVSNNALMWLIIAAAVTIWYALHAALIKLIGTAFNFNEKTDLILRTYITNIVLLGTAHLPIGIAMVYSSEQALHALFIVAIALYAVMLVDIAVKCVQILGTKVNTVVYIFLYLCSAEIMPLIAAYIFVRSTPTFV